MKSDGSVGGREQGARPRFLSVGAAVVGVGALVAGVSIFARNADAQRAGAAPSASARPLPRAAASANNVVDRLRIIDAGVATPAASAVASAVAAVATPSALASGVSADAGLTRNRQGPPPPPNVSPRCPAGMVLAEGEYCTQVEQVCTRWLDADQPDPLRCAEFQPSRCIGRRRPMSVCIDQFEAPNQRGAYPQVMLTWYQARRACEQRGARLCNMAEWTFACEGPEMLPYPYGYQRDTNACHLDHQTRRPDRARLGNSLYAADESARLYEAAPSGQWDRCTSPFGVRDMTGNVDEWVTNETGRPYQSGLKGGWWGPIRGRCRPATIAHNETFIYYQIGYRCCADPQPAAAGTAPASASAAPAPAPVNTSAAPSARR